MFLVWYKEQNCIESTKSNYDRDMFTSVRPTNVWKIPNVYRLSLVWSLVLSFLWFSGIWISQLSSGDVWNRQLLHLFIELIILNTNYFILVVIFVGKGGKDGNTSDPNKTTTNPASSPSKWPGVRLLLSLLATENKDNSTKLRIMLGEACVAVYLSLLALAWSNSQPNQLYRLVVNSLKAGMWGMVFGGGLRSALQQSGGGYNFYST